MADDSQPRGRGMSRAMKTRLVIFSTALLVVLIIFVYMQGERTLAAEHNRIVEELVQAGEYRQAVAELEPLVDRAGFTIREQMRDTLAMCYAGVGDDPGLSIAESAAWYRKAKDINPELINEMRQRVLDTAGTMQ